MKQSSELVEQFKELARRDRRLGIVRRQWSPKFDTAALQSMDLFWNEYKRILGGRERATDYLIILMRYGFETLEEVEKANARKQKRQRGHQVGAEDESVF